MIVEPLSIPDVKLLTPRIFRDARGSFLETWRDERYELLGIATPFVQDNVSVSMRGVLRGLHFQHPQGQGKLVTVLAGSVFDAAVDVRRGSPTFGKWVGHELSADTGQQLWVPPGFAHGFMVTSERAVFSYKCTAYYSLTAEHSLLWDDPAIGIVWPDAAPILSDKDAAAPRLAECPPDHLPLYQEPNHG
jgi:dTDP-4-dehydrorhamnose 3,5-epimerase